MNTEFSQMKLLKFIKYLNIGHGKNRLYIPMYNELGESFIG